MSDKDRQFEIVVNGEKMLERVISILEQARANVVKAVNSNMIIAYWLIGREIVHEIQQGQDRAEYGKKALAELSDKLTKMYGKGFSVTNLRYFRLFFQIYSDRNPEIRHTICDESEVREKHHKPCDVLEDMSLAIEKSDEIGGFSPLLSWSHYRTLTKIEHKNERLFYEIEAEKEGWSVAHLQKGKDDNPTVGLILCTEKDKAIVKYSVLNENKQLFASKYMLYLPSEEVLVQELEREKRMIDRMCS